jgi:signal transduction histidine kinase
MEKGVSIELQTDTDEFSHEIRTPLNAIIGLSQLIYTFPDNKEENMAFAKVIEGCANQLLVYSRKCLKPV